MVSYENEENKEKIDIVYLWCDGNDPAFKKRKNEYLGIKDNLKADNVSGDIRFYDNDELKYSLRSLEMYAPWINHVYIITDRQRPKWLNTGYDKVTIIDHSEIMPKECIPCFSSTTIEYFLPYVPNLNEKFLFSNDDMFFGGPVTPEDFYIGNKPIVRVKPLSSIIRFKRFFLKLLGKYEKIEYKVYFCILNSLDLLRKEYGKSNCFSIQHNIDAYTKSAYIDTLLKFDKHFKATQHYRFRNKNCFQRIIFGLDAVYSGKAVLQPLLQGNSFSRFLGLSPDKKVFSYFGKEQNLNKVIADITTLKPKLFCLNAGSDSTINTKQRTKQFMETMFPYPSKFEK